MGVVIRIAVVLT